MGFFNILETFFFISLAITFVLIIMLVYHFKGRLVLLEQKCDTMFEIMSNMTREMKNIQIRIIESQKPVENAPSQPNGIRLDNNLGIPSNIFQLLNLPQFSNLVNQEGEEGEEDDEEDDEDDRKIVVSDSEVDDEDEIKVINIDISEPFDDDSSMPELEEVLDDEDEDIGADEYSSEQKDDIEVESEQVISDESLEKTVDYNKLDVSYLRTMVLTRGLATNTKKLKKSELIKLLSE